MIVLLLIGTSASIISVVIVLAGTLCILAMPIEQYPNIVPPSVSVSAVYPGASADVVESVLSIFT